MTRAIASLTVRQTFVGAHTRPRGLVYCLFLLFIADAQLAFDGVVSPLACMPWKLGCSTPGLRALALGPGVCRRSSDLAIANIVWLLIAHAGQASHLSVNILPALAISEQSKLAASHSFSSLISVITLEVKAIHSVLHCRQRLYARRVLESSSFS